LFWLSFAAAIGLLVVGAFAFQTDSAAAGLAVLTTGVATAGAALMVGGTLGFIFGIPRTRSAGQRSGNAAAENNQSNQEKGQAPATGEDQQRTDVEGNTNLEEISDWLTKMLVGVGLTQLYKVPAQLGSLTRYVAKGLVGPEDAPLILIPPEAFALGVIVYFLFVGFLFGFLWTRFVLTPSLRGGAEARLRHALETRAVAILQERIDKEAKTWRPVRQQLYAREADVVVPQAELDTVVREASPDMKSDIFYEAARVRRETWQTDKTRMERTIPIFRALCRTDTENKYHANHGQLGFALKDKENATQGDYEEAERELTTAIAIRDRVSPGKILPFYEFNRAVCRIRLGATFEQRVGDRAVDEITSDLREAYAHSYFRKIIDEDRDNVIKPWLADKGLPPFKAPQP
jgi:hypothetical protein